MDWVGFALAVLLIELTPGPNMAWLAGLAAVDGLRTGRAAVWGIALGLLANGMLAAVGLAALVQAVPQIWYALRLAGAGMMVWLALDAWRGAGTVRAADQPGLPPRRAFATGLAINLANPKAYVFFLVVVPQFLRGRVPDLHQALAFSLVSAAIATAIQIAVISAGAGAHRWLSDPARTRTVRRVFAAIMLGVALSFLLADFT